MSKRQVILTFPEHLIKEPLIYMMSREFGVIPNIRRAKITETAGEVTLELDGPDDSVEKALEYFEHKGVKVEPLTGEVLSG